MLVSLFSVHVLATCYGMDGSQMNSNYVPCNSTVDPSSSSASVDGIHTACCNAANSDICLSSGLCLSTTAIALGHVLWLNGCTDKTLQDPSCPQYCRNMKNAPGPSDTYFLRSCDRNMTGNSWCCGVEGQNISECCSRKFKLRSNIGHLVQQLSVGDAGGGVTQNGRGNNDNTNDGVPFITPSIFGGPTSTEEAQATETSTTTSGNRGLIAGLSVVSAIAAIALIALIVAVLRIRRLSRRNRTVVEDPSVRQNDNSASAAPQVVDNPSRSQSQSAPQNPPGVEHRAIDNTANTATTTHELSPISARSEPCEILSEAGEGSVLRSLSMDGPATRSSMMIAELPAEDIVKHE